jgi:hypothetical protein
MKLYMFRTVRLSIVRSLITVHSAMVYVIQVCRLLSTNLYMFRTVPLSIIRNLFTLHSAIVYVIQVCIAECTVNKLLMMDRGTVRNM